MELTRQVGLQRGHPTRMDLTRLYDSTAWYWDSLPHRLSYGYAYVQLFKQLVRDGWLRGMNDTSKVLDCGIGAGLLTDALLQTVNKQFEAYGIDLSQKLLARAKAQLMRRGAVLRIVPGDIHSLPFRGGEMEMVLSGLMLEHVPAPLDALREMTRVAQGGAPLVLIATRPHAPNHLFRLKYRYKPWPPQQLIGWMREAGITDIRAYPLVGIARLFGRAYVGRTPASAG